MVPDAALSYFDLIGIMAYDAIGPTWVTQATSMQAMSRLRRTLHYGLVREFLQPKLALGTSFLWRGFGQFRPELATERDRRRTWPRRPE